MIEGKQIFLTGGAGFIGTKIIERLIPNNKIVVYDTLQRNSLKDTHFSKHQNLTLIKGNVLDNQNLEKFIKNSEIIIHLAAIAGIDTVIKSPTTTMNVNFVGTSNVLEAAAKLDTVERFVDFSTSEVYGSFANKLEESSATTLGGVGNARWTYAISKLAAEHLSHSFFSEFNLPVTSIRPFNIYGPGQVGEGAIHNFITRAIRNEDLVIHGDGDQIRSWCYIDDIVDCILLCLENKDAVGEVFNIGNPRSTITILSLAEKIISLSKSSSNIVFVPKNYVDVELRIPEIEKSKNILGFNPKIDLNTGILKTIDYYKKF
jgi:dTDP-glucose 4,6-dehydratase